VQLHLDSDPFPREDKKAAKMNGSLSLFQKRRKKKEKKRSSELQRLAEALRSKKKGIQTSRIRGVQALDWKSGAWGAWAVWDEKRA